MCLRPITISHDNKNLLYRNLANNFLGRFDPSNISSQLVPCGNCEECVKTRQSQHAYKLYQRISGLNCCYHITFTYKPETIPFALSYNYIDGSTGEVFRITSPEIVSDVRSLSSLREWYSQQVKSSSPLYFYSQPFKLEENFIEAVFTPSLNRSDLRSAIKVNRILFKRKFGYDVNFVYSFCGEYGPKKSRPHYHCVIASKDDISSFVTMLSSYWEVKFGFTVVKKVNRVNDNNTDGYELVCRYLSKYMSKGDFECQSVIDGYSEKGRICQSQGLDPRLKSDIFTDEIIPYYRAYDLFGSYSPITLRLDKSGKKLSPSQMDILCDEILKRSFVSIGLSKVSIPRYLKEACFYVKKNQDGHFVPPPLAESQSKVLRTPLSYLVSYRFQELQAQDRDKELERIKKSGIAHFIQSKESSLRLRAECFNKNYKNFLSGSFSSQ